MGSTFIFSRAFFSMNWRSWFFGYFLGGTTFALHPTGPPRQAQQVRHPLTPAACRRWCKAHPGEKAPSSECAANQPHLKND